MTAERRRAAALNGRHHLHLVEADVSGIGRTPRRPVIAEDIRDLQLWTEHCRRRLGLRLIVRAAPSTFPGPLALWPRQPVERALDGGNHAGGDVDITCGGFQLLMTQQYLDLSDMGVDIEQVSGETVPQRMQRHAFLDPRSVGRCME